MEKKSIDELVQRVYFIFNQLNAQSELDPNDTVNSLFSSLLYLALNSEPITSKEAIRQIQMDGKLQDIIDLCCASEIELERYWANRIIEGENDLTQFPYHGNYVLLTKFELEQMQKYMELDGKRLLFVGSGALPLTAMMFKQQQPSLSIQCIDKDAEFVRLSRALLSRLGISYLPISSHDIASLDSDVQSMLSTIDIVFIAALVGKSNVEKNQILSDIQPYLKSGSLVAVRSVPDDLRRLIYPKFDLDDALRIKYRALGEYLLPRETGVINSIVVLSRR